MARAVGPDQRDVRAVDPVTGFLQSKAGRPVVIYAAASGSALADVLLDADGSVPAGSSVDADENSQLPLIRWPDGSRDPLYAECDGGPRWPIFPRVDDRLDQLEAAAGTTASASTGLLYGGELLSTAGSVATFAAGAGQIVDDTDRSAVTVTDVTWPETDIDLAGSGDGVRHVYVDDSGTVLYSDTAPSHAEYRAAIQLRRVSVRSGVISGTTSVAAPLLQLAAQIFDSFRAAGPRKSGLVPAPAGADLTFAVGEGELYAFGAGFESTLPGSQNPHEVEYPAKSPVTFRMVTRAGAQSADTTVLDRANYDVGGVVTPIPGATTRATVFTVMMFAGSGGVVRVFYGQQFFTTVNDAVTALRAGSVVAQVPASYKEAVVLGWIVAQSGAANLSDGVQQFIGSDSSGERPTGLTVNYV